jgi:hypothetical protein
MGASYTSTFIPISNIISSFASYCFHIILFCELYRYCQNGFQKIKVNILNFQNEYSKLTMTVLFFSLKWMILRIGISIPEFFSPRSIYKYSGFELSLSFQYTQLTCSILTFVFCIYFLRKILVEFFISYGRPPSWLYWLCLIPIFDYIIWLVVIFSFEKKNNQTERLNLFETENDNLSLVIFMIIIQLFSMYRGLVDNEFSESFFKFFICLGVVNAILTILAYKNIAPLKFIFWLMVLSAIISLGFVIKPLNGVYSEATLIMLAFSLFSIAVIVHFFPIFHLQEFLYIGGEDEEIAKENIE